MAWFYSMLVFLGAFCQYESAFASNKILTIVSPGQDVVYSERLLLGAQQASHDFDVDLKQRFLAP
jgi:hypothetical protein